MGLNYQRDEIDIILITTALKHFSKQLLMLKSLPNQSININDCTFQGYLSTENQKHPGWHGTCFYKHDFEGQLLFVLRLKWVWKSCGPI